MKIILTGATGYVGEGVMLELLRTPQVEKVLFPYHYSETDLTSIPAQLSEEGIDVRIRHYE